MGFIPDDIINQVLERTDIVETIGSYLPLKQAGRNFKGLCPFHHEKTPSFVVTPDKQIFHCFGCHVGGNVLKFVMLQERMEFPEAVRFLADKVQVVIPDTSGQNPDRIRLSEQLFDANAKAAQYFRGVLLRDKGAEAEKARQYLKDRGVTLDTVQAFQIGLALDKWDGLMKYLRDQGVAVKLMEQAGLIVPRRGGDGFYDRFRARVMFPIFDYRGRCVAFGGRTLGDDPAKYMNSPDTPVYTKGRHLYGFHVSKEAAGQEDRIIVVEGYMDFLIPFQAGVKPVVASCGTALTTDQIRLMRRYTRNVIMLFDTDAAGQSAMLRSLDLLIDEDMQVSVVTLDQGQDPDSFVRKHGVEGFQQRIGQAVSLFEYKLRQLKQAHDVGSVEGKAKIADGMLATIARYQNEVAKSEYIRQLSAAIGIPQNVLWSQMTKSPTEISASRRQAAPLPKPVRLEKTAEYYLLRLLLLDKRWIEASRQDLQPDDIQNEMIKSLVELINAQYAQGKNIRGSELIQACQDEQTQSLVTGLMSEENLSSDDQAKVYRDCMQRIKKKRLQDRRKVLTEQIRAAEQSGDSHEVNKLKEEFNQLIRG